MFVLPPPPKYPAPAQSNAPVVETNNLISHPSGSDFQFVAGEGTYVLRDDLLLATPPAHPSETTVTNPNPLATTIPRPTAGTKLSFAIISPRNAAYHPARSETPDSHESSASMRSPSGSHPEHDARSNWDSNAASTSIFRPGVGALDGDYSHINVFGATNPALSSGAVNGKEKDPSKRRKPKSNMVKSNSSFVSRVIPHEGLAKRLQEHAPAGLFAFANVNRSLQWLDLSSSQKAENLTKILFTKAHALCHSVNPLTTSSSHIDLVMGFSTGDVIWYEPMSQKYSRINKNGIINASAVTDIHWLPGSENLFITAGADGTLVVYDKEKEDVAFVPESSIGDGEVQGGWRSPQLHVLKSVQSRNQRANPVAFYKLSNARINSLAINPRGTHLALAVEDGTLRIVDLHREVLIAQFPSYYGGLLCCTWSPDGRYILTGGQDDLVSIWSFEDMALVARGQGHTSWVTSVQFDPWRCDGRNWRFGSLGEDGRLLLWDFSVGMLHRPRAASVRQRGSVVSGLVGRSRSLAESEIARLRSVETLECGAGSDGEEEIVHALEPRARAPVLPPVMAKAIDEHPLSWLAFEEDAIITTCADGHVRTWDRPKEGTLPPTTGAV